MRRQKLRKRAAETVEERNAWQNGVLGQGPDPDLKSILQSSPFQKTRDVSADEHENSDTGESEDNDASPSFDDGSSSGSGSDNEADVDNSSDGKGSKRDREEEDISTSEGESSEDGTARAQKGNGKDKAGQKLRPGRAVNAQSGRSVLHPNFLKHITISDDQSYLSEFKARILSILKPRDIKPLPVFPPLQSTSNQPTRITGLYDIIVVEDPTDPQSGRKGYPPPPPGWIGPPPPGWIGPPPGGPLINDEYPGVIVIEDNTAQYPRWRRRPPSRTGHTLTPPYTLDTDPDIITIGDSADRRPTYLSTFQRPPPPGRIGPPTPQLVASDNPSSHTYQTGAVMARRERDPMNWSGVALSPGFPQSNDSLSHSVDEPSGSTQRETHAFPKQSDYDQAASDFITSIVNPKAEAGPSVQLDGMPGLGKDLSGSLTNPLPDLESLQEYILDLQRKAKCLEDLERQQEPSRLQILYRILQDHKTTVYFDHPEWTTGQGSSRKLRSTLPVSNLSSYLDKHRDLAFIVYRDFEVSDSATGRSLDVHIEDENNDVVPPVRHSGEEVVPVSKDLRLAVKTLLGSMPEFIDILRYFNQNAALPAPYLFIYHSRSTIQDLMQDLPDRAQRQLSLLLDYIYSEHGGEYKAVDSLLAKSKITLPYFKYLFKPGDVLVQGKDRVIRGLISKSSPINSNFRQQYEPSPYSRSKLSKDTKIQTFDIDVWSWTFSGTFRRQISKLKLDFDANDLSEKNIDDLDVRPLKYASDTVTQTLKRRGETFWKCRSKYLVSYNEDVNRDMQSSGDERFMIDMMTYRELHARDEKLFAEGDPSVELDAETMKQDHPPGENFVYLLPLTIIGYNLRRKKWVDLQVDQISEVIWNKEAFKSLVLDRKTKDLIQALISNQLAAEKSTDLISGKGNGLILLLHGGPGTGKTLTAESVAEIAEKPLYRVTCGDIGTEPEVVEKYLESVLHLGKIWGCVVLLDEADVFLEQRSLEDLQRNALVSVFLRVLEYYDGILILTSNRVGTFDEAFKSRIQLALHYASLGPFQRHKIWENFILRLGSLGEEDIDFDDLKDHLEQLAENKMNGRQIRNAITTARQYVQWKKTTLTYEHLKDIIEISGRFDLYLDKLNGGYTQDQLAEDEGLRLSQAL